MFCRRFKGCEVQLLYLNSLGRLILGIKIDNVPSSQLERLFFLEHLACFTNRVSRDDLKTRFGISEASAAKDFAIYNEAVPDRIFYDKSGKTYRWNERAITYFQHPLHNTLSALVGERVIAAGGPGDGRMEGEVPMRIRRALDSSDVSTITRAIGSADKIHCSYFSISSGKTDKTLAPVAIFYDGVSWHFRAYDEAKSAFRNFSFARVEGVTCAGAAQSGISAFDTEWHKKVQVRLVPHPKASEGARETTVRDYRMEDGAIEISMSAALVGFFLRHWRVDVTEDAKLPPREYQLFLGNRNELVSGGIDRYSVTYSHA